MSKISILGAGAFGTAMASVCARNPSIAQVTIYARSHETVDHLNKHHVNSKYFPEFKLSDKIIGTTSVKESLADSKFVLCCIPVQQMPNFLNENKNYIQQNDKAFISCSKGIIQSNGQLLSELYKQVIGEDRNFGILSGPSFAKEILKKDPTVVVVASQQEHIYKLVQTTMSDLYFRIYGSTDVLGVEIAGAFKNIIALGAGIVEGKGFGLNTQTALVVRAARELQIFAHKKGAQKHTLYGLAGIGDIILTSLGNLSRNKQCGLRLGQGETIENILKSSKGVVEGIPTLYIVAQQAQSLGLDLPIVQTIYKFVKNEITEDQAFSHLMNRALELEEPTFEDTT